MGLVKYLSPNLNRYPLLNNSGHDGKAMRGWALRHRVELRFSRLGKPTDNPFIESFNGKFRDEFLNANCFTSLSSAHMLADTWRGGIQLR